MVHEMGRGACEMERENERRRGNGLGCCLEEESTRMTSMDVENLDLSRIPSYRFMEEHFTNAVYEEENLGLKWITLFFVH